MREREIEVKLVRKGDRGEVRGEVRDIYIYIYIYMGNATLTSHRVYL